MTTKIQTKRRTSGGALVIGTAPLTISAVAAGEQVYDAIADILYIGKGDDGSNNSTSIAAIGGVGAFLALSRLGAANGAASLDGTGKLPTAQLPASIAGAMVYQGTWNASTNSPALATGVGTKGYYYKVSVAGTTTLDGNNNWNVGDMVVFDGTTWDKIDGPAEAVISVAGRIGAITLTSSDLTDGTAFGRSLFTAANLAAAKAILAYAVADVSGAAPLASPTLTGVPTAPTATAGTNTTQLATTAFVLANAGAPSTVDGGAI
jgi:hypothetical protein